MSKLLDAEVKIMILHAACQSEVIGILKEYKYTPTQATSVPMTFNTGTIWLPTRTVSSILDSQLTQVTKSPSNNSPFVTLLSKLGLKASPEKKVRSPGCPSNLASSLYSLQTVLKRAIPPTGSAEEASIW